MRPNSLASILLVTMVAVVGSVSAEETAETTVVIETRPSGAHVLIDGTPRGQTPLTVEGLAPGEHQLLLQKGSAAGGRTFEVKSGKTLRITEKLKAARRETQGRSIGGGVLSWIVPPLVGGGSVLAAKALSTESAGPYTSGVVVAPSANGIAGVTDFTFSALGVGDREGDPVRYTWDLGDGAEQEGESVTHRYERGGTYRVELALSDGSHVTRAETTVVVVDITGEWHGRYVFVGNVSLQLSQVGTNISGIVETSRTSTAVSFTCSARGNVTGTVKAPREVELTLTFTRTGAPWQWACCVPNSMTGTIDLSGRVISARGYEAGDSYSHLFTLSR